MPEKNIFEYITAYADGELTQSETDVLLKEAAADKRIKRAIDSEIKFKNFLNEKLKREKMPSELRYRVLETMSKLQEGTYLIQKSHEPTKPQKDDKITGSKVQYKWFLAAAVLLISIFIISYQWFNNQSSEPVLTNNDTSISVEFLTATHFQNHNGGLLKPSFEASTASEAQEKLRELYNTSITVPELEGATFAGVVYADFYEGYHTPLLEYEVTDGDYIYIFAFEMKHLGDQNTIIREPEAIKSIVKNDDVYMLTYNGHDVVSWKWEDVWYSGVSHHSGEVLAAMLPH